MLTFREHNDTTMTALEETMDLVEEEIRVARAKFEEDILRIGEKMENPNAVNGTPSSENKSLEGASDF